jgi:hypothetical protein
MGTWAKSLALMCGFLLLLAGPPAWGQETAKPDADPEKPADMRALADRINNPVYGFTLSFTPVVPAPAWSKEPLL